MKKLIASILLIFPIIVIAQSPCSGGSASGYPCEGYDLQSNFTLNDLDATFCNDSWGWTDPTTDKEYALVGLNNGTAFIDISDPVNPIYLGKLPTHNGFLDFRDVWRDIKVFNNHAFIVSEITGHGMQVFDLTRLRNVANPPAVFTEDAHFDEFSRCHNIVINEAKGYAYPVGCRDLNDELIFGGGPIFVNIDNPTNPVGEGGYALDGYTHDAQIVTYNGPDSDHVGKELMIGSNADAVVIVDITDKSNPLPISLTSYGNVGYTHQGWFTEDQRYFILGDEVDEIDFGFNTRILIFDMLDLDNPEFHFEYFGPTEATDHNGYVVGDKFYMATYRAGMRVHDISDIANQNMNQIGFFDTVPESDEVNTNDGAWNVYPFFQSGNIVITDQTDGFFLVRDPNFLSSETVEERSDSFAVFPNPANEYIQIMSNTESINQIEVFNLLGQRIVRYNFDKTTTKTIDTSALDAGIYLVKINENTTKRVVIN